MSTQLISLTLLISLTSLQEIVALSGAHTLGRAYPNRSGHGVASTPYTETGVPQGHSGPGTKGGQSWTANWLTFDNS